MTTRPCPLDGAAVASGQVLCAGCTTRLRLDLEDVPRLLRELDTAITRQTSMPPASGTVRCGHDGCTHGPDEPGCVQGVRLDLDVRASEASMALRTVLHGWVRVWDEETPISPLSAWAGVRRERDRLLSSTQGQAALLRARLGSISAAAWLPDLAQELRDAVREGWAACDRPPDAKVVGACSACHRPLYAPEGATQADCAACGRRQDVADTRAAAIAEADHAREQAFPKADISRIVGVPVGTLHRWSSEGRIVAAGVTPEGRPVFTLGPIADAVRNGAAPPLPARQVDALTCSEASSAQAAEM